MTTMLTRQRSVVLLTGPHGGPSPRQRRQIMHATPGWSWRCEVVHSGESAGSIARHAVGADVVVCTSDEVRAAVEAFGVRVIHIDGPWPEAEEWSDVLDAIAPAGMRSDRPR